MTIIIACAVVVVLIIIGLIIFNSRSTSAAKETASTVKAQPEERELSAEASAEARKDASVPAAAPVRNEPEPEPEPVPEPAADIQPAASMPTRTASQTARDKQRPNVMNDTDYRNALKNMGQHAQHAEPHDPASTEAETKMADDQFRQALKSFYKTNHGDRS
ncbi:hypothetical protein Q5741_05875 [Paenibacillus sp. JX-17]|uniref:Uncharacterized protein n=1 Tax=Paenibacillus lacisoli TaxID=3064525 RepID=A0ABT9C9K8_9BACL|nr:hypothetical protein [Paenibacillus sp. JX-17]MDO7905946.1 hypothetical protein [Paenibacillus sp. JX-17]